MTSQSQKVLDIQKAVDEKVTSRLPAVLFNALVRQHERTGFRTGCTCKYCNEKRIVSHIRGYGCASYYAMSNVNYEMYRVDRLEKFRNKVRSRLREVSEKELDDFTRNS